ncbi:unnamed protein product [Miscanthus lutarioriparius]|uniref:Uncharacterized protein n=1 Tax=Miscanthus lutarioriparius TaxID=422564 RepID=A0A811QTG8_9POAL|nr:unnamed protein product [Miscanthus lutarioriparius]
MSHRQHILFAIVLMAVAVLQAVSTRVTAAANLTGDDAAKTAYDVTLPGECNFFVTVAGKQFKFRYESSVSGIITSGSISRVSGVRIQVEFAWLGLNQVSRAGNQLNIQLEKSTQSFPINAFAPSARCS